MTQPDTGPVHPALSRIMNFAVRYCWIVGVVVCVGAVWLLGPGKIWEALSGVKPGVLVLLLGIQLCADWGRALKWYYVLGRGSNAIGVYFMSKAAGYWTPGRVGELSPLMLKTHRTPRMGAWIVVDRLLETAVTLALGAGGLMLLRANLSNGYVRFAAVACVLIAVASVAITRQGLFAWIAGHLKPAGLLHRIALFLEETTSEVLLLRGKLPLAMAITVFSKVLDVTVWVLVYASLGESYGISFALAAVAMCLGGLVASIPITPILTGVPYLAQGALLVEVGGIPPEVAAVALGLHFAVTNCMFWASVAVGAHDLRKRP